MARPMKKNYDPEVVMKTLIQTVEEVYKEKGRIRTTAAELDLAEHKVKKLLITSGALVYPQTEEIQRLIRCGKQMSEIMEETGLSRASINFYLPYSKIPYKESEISANADRCVLYRKRRDAVEGLANRYELCRKRRDTADIADAADTVEGVADAADTVEGIGDSLWNCIVLFQGYKFKTATGLPFQYNIKKGRNGEYTKELWIDRRGESKSLTMSTVLKAYEKAEELRGTVVSRPKSLGDLRGVSYIYPIFYRFGLIDVPERIAEKMKQ